MHVSLKLLNEFTEGPDKVENQILNGDSSEMWESADPTKFIPWDDHKAWVEHVREMYMNGPCVHNVFKGHSGSVFLPLSRMVMGSDQHLKLDKDAIDAARQSTRTRENQTLERNVRTLKYMFIHNHTSPFEHVDYTFELSMPIAVARQWMRHRMASPNELSLRFEELKLTEENVFVPKHYRKQSDTKLQCSSGLMPTDAAKEAAEVYKKSIESSTQSYKTLIDMGLARELSRLVLPTAVHTEVIWKQDLHNLMHLVKLRTDSHAQPEIQVIAHVALMMTARFNPLTFAMFTQKLAVHRQWNAKLNRNLLENLILV